MKANVDSQHALTDRGSTASHATWAYARDTPASKRVLDVVLSTALLIVLAPVLSIVGLLVRSSSPGPVLFSQQRVGKHGRLFWMYKFRTMYADADTARHKAYAQALIRGQASRNGSVYKLTSDPRVTPVGHILRSTSLDELPQLLNVLAGDMSLVGPRPQLPYETELYGPREWRRQVIAPGITGLWQVSGRNRLTFQQMIDLDLRYVDQWSIWLDIKIMALTSVVLLASRDLG